MGLGNLGHLGLAALPGFVASPGLPQEGTSSPRSLQVLKSPVYMESWELLKKMVILAKAPAARGGRASSSCSGHHGESWSAEMPIRVDRSQAFAVGNMLVRLDRNRKGKNGQGFKGA